MRILQAFADRAWFILWRPARRPDGSWNKVPCDANGTPTNAHDRSTWMLPAFAEAMAAATGYHIGIVLHDGCQLACVDVDHALDRNTGQWSPLAHEMCAKFPGALVEVSYSGDGLHIFFSYSGPRPDHGTRAPGIEVYTFGRFIALTGTSETGDPRTDHTAALHALIAERCNAPASERVDKDWWTDAPDPAFPWPNRTDEEIIALVKARPGSTPRADASVFTTGRMPQKTPSGLELWEADESALGEAYPHATNAYDASSADMALANMVMRETGYDCARTERIMRQSELVRDAWDSNPYKLGGAIRRAGDGLSAAREHWAKCLVPKTARAPDAAPAAAGKQPNPSDILGALDQAELFAGCCYVTALNRILGPGATEYDEPRFNATFGLGRTFLLNADGSKHTKKPWDSYLNNEMHLFPRAAKTYFSPDDAPMTMRDDAVNNWWPPAIAAEPGDISPFLSMMAKQLPDERDRQILLSWMAACVQYPGKKFRWSPFVQGAKGGGKTTFVNVLTYAVGRRYVERPRANHLDGQFNGNLDAKVLACVDDINLHGRYELWDALKPMITEDVSEVERKGIDRTTVYGNVLKFFFTGNEKRALPHTPDERRLAPFFLAQQTEADLIRDDLHETFFAEYFYPWLQREGYAYLAHYLQTYQIPDQFNPARTARAPKTSFTEEHIRMSRPRHEQQLLNDIEAGRIGLDGRVTELDLELFLQRNRATEKVAPECRAELMASVGFPYVGRAAPDAARVRQLIYSAHPLPTG